MICYLTCGDGWATCKCSCGNEFDVDVFFQENLIFVNNVLHAKCPSCLYVDGDEVGCLFVYDKIEII